MSTQPSEHATAHLRDLDELVKLVRAPEEDGLLEQQRRHHATDAPHVERVVVVANVNQQLRALVETRGHAHWQLLAGVVEVGEAPVDEAELALFMVDEYVARLDLQGGAEPGGGEGGTSVGGVCMQCTWHAEVSKWAIELHTILLKHSSCMNKAAVSVCCFTNSLKCNLK
eukprot:365224-Chlamydomonas_euryale.AAC.13